MGWLDTGPPQREYTPKLIYRILRSIEHAVNYMTEQNFKNGISGTVINPGTLPGNTIAKGQLTLGQLNWKEWPIPLILLATPFTTNSEEGENIEATFLGILNYPWRLVSRKYIRKIAAIATVTVRVAVNTSIHK